MIAKMMKEETYVLLGSIMVLGTLLKLFGFFNIDSDWFWFLAGIALTLEGIMNLVKQKRFEKKYKILTKEEYDALIPK